MSAQNNNLREKERTDQRALASCMKSPILLMEYLGDDSPLAVNFDERVEVGE